MSSADRPGPDPVYGYWSPPGPPVPGPGSPAPRLPAAPHRPPRVAYVLAVLLPLVLVGLLAAPAGVAWTLGSRARPAATSPVPGAPDPTDPDGSRGLGDPYYPDAGNGGYEVDRYDVDVSWEPDAQRLSGRTTIRARAAQDLHSFYLDLALTTSRVTVDGQDAGYAPEGFSDLRITPARPVAAGAEFVVVVDYAGQPGTLSDQGVDPYYVTDREWTIAGEPESSAWWFPANDHPSDPALMDVSIRVPSSYQAISGGRLASRDTGDEAGFDTWHWVSSQPVATYLSFLSVGRYDLEQGTANGLPYVYAVSQQLPAEQRQQALTALETSDETVTALSALFGPYPFSELGGLVTSHDLPFGGLETQTRPIYAAQAILDRGFSRELIVHELAHMWFGDQVTLAQWNDIFDSEAYASWAAWAVAEREGGRSAEDELRRTYAGTRGERGFWSVTMIDPGRERLFDTVYERGPMTLQALSNVMGADAFARLNREWAQEPGARSLEDWMTRAQALTPVDLGPFFQAWIFATTAPADTAQNGLG